MCMSMVSCKFSWLLTSTYHSAYSFEVVSTVELDFIFTDSWNYWMYSQLTDVMMLSGLNSIKLSVSAQNGGPNIDHLRIGKPPAVVLRTNGW